MVYVLAVTAAALFAAGSVVQQRVARQSPPDRAFSARLLLWLVRQRGWLAGVVISAVGNILAALALGRGGVALVGAGSSAETSATGTDGACPA